jgi:hypothetical protein
VAVTGQIVDDGSDRGLVDVDEGGCGPDPGERACGRPIPALAPLIMATLPV